MEGSVQLFVATVFAEAAKNDRDAAFVGFSVEVWIGRLLQRLVDRLSGLLPAADIPAIRLAVQRSASEIRLSHCRWVCRTLFLAAVVVFFLPIRPVVAALCPTLAEFRM